MDKVALALNVTATDKSKSGEVFQSESDMLNKVKEEDDYFTGGKFC